jgi:hypothetical protein
MGQVLRMIGGVFGASGNRFLGSILKTAAGGVSKNPWFDPQEFVLAAGVGIISRVRSVGFSAIHGSGRRVAWSRTRL